MRRAGGDQHALAAPAPAPLRAAIGSTAAAISSGSAMRPMPLSPASAISPSLGPTKTNAVGGKLREIALRRLVRPHARVHRRRQQHLRRRRQQHGGGEIVGVTAGHLGHQVGGGRRHHDQIGLARQPDVADVELVRRIEQVGEDALADDGAGRQRRDEMLGRLGQDAAHGEPALLQPADQVERLVGGDAAADDQQHALGRGRRGAARLPARGGGKASGAAASGLVGGGAQDGAHLVLDRAAVAWPRAAAAASSARSSSWRTVRRGHEKSLLMQ